MDSLKDTHFVRPERGAGKGYADIVIVPRDGRGPSAVLELKRAGKRSSDRAMEEMAEKAVAQIKEKRYFADLRGDVLLYGVAFRQTDVFVRFERMEKQRTGCWILLRCRVHAPSMLKSRYRKAVIWNSPIQTT